MQKEKEKIQQYLDLAPVVFLLLDTDNRVQMINQKGCYLIGSDINEIIGKTWLWDFVCDVDFKPVENTILNNESETASLPSHFESKLRRNTGELLIRGIKYIFYTLCLCNCIEICKNMNAVSGHKIDLMPLGKPGHANVSVSFQHIKILVNIC